MEENREPKISFTEAMLIGLPLLGLDIIDLIPVAGDITDIVALPINYYMHIKGVNGIPFLISEALDLIPVVQEFPLRSIAWWGTVAFDHFAPQELVEVTEKIGEKMEGKGEVNAVTGGAADAVDQAAKDALSSQTEGRMSRALDESAENPLKKNTAEAGEGAPNVQDFREFGPPPGPMEDLDQEYFNRSPYEMMHEAETEQAKEAEAPQEAERPNNVIDFRKQQAPDSLSEVQHEWDRPEEEAA